MHNTTYRRHFKILTFIENELIRILDHSVRYSDKRHYKSIISILQTIKWNLRNVKTTELSDLRKNEKELLKIIKENSYLNKDVSIASILKK